MKPRTLALALLLACCAGSGATQALPPDLQLKLACSHSEGEGEARDFYADNGEIGIKDGQLQQFRWESSLHRRTHGFDCSIDQDDHLDLDVVGGQWRVQLRDALASRAARGYDTVRGENCIIRLIRRGEYLLLQPSCAILCGSRSNFSELRIHLPSGRCQYPALQGNGSSK
ncbi:MAG: hypothetical protein RL748_2272 [Pseudomonadota bacterium]|jgi:hypothetical protein